jgi:hypothetical protein
MNNNIRIFIQTPNLIPCRVVMDKKTPATFFVVKKKKYYVCEIKQPDDDKKHLFRLYNKNNINFDSFYFKKRM